MSKQAPSNFERGYNLADSYIKQKFKNIEKSHAKDEEFNKGYAQRLAEENEKAQI